MNCFPANAPIAASVNCNKRTQLPDEGARIRARLVHRGVTLLEMLIALGVLGGVVAAVSRLAQDAGDEARASVTALHTRTVGDAASAYIKDNYASIQAVATATTPALIRVTDLVATGYLPAGFSESNAHQQSACVLVLEPTADRLTGLLIAEGGETIDDLSLGQVASLVGGAGGGIYSNEPTVARGAMGGYSFEVGAYGNTNHAGLRCNGVAGDIVVAAGRPLMALEYVNGAQASSTLYREKDTGTSALTTMNTSILMGPGSQQSIGAACTSSGAIGSSASGATLVCEGGAWKQGGSAYWKDPAGTFSSLPRCTSATTNHTRVVQNSGAGTGTRAYVCNGSSWLPLAIGDMGNLSQGTTIVPYGRIPGVPGSLTVDKLDGSLEIDKTSLAGNACSPNGSLARADSGNPLTCVSGRWASVGARSHRTVFATGQRTTSEHEQTASCGYGEVVVSGGGSCYSNDSRIFMIESIVNSSRSGWTVTCAASDPPRGTKHVRVDTYAICRQL